MKKVSIIIPIFNTGKHLAVCLNSIKAQSYINFEVLMIDDGSTDNSASICIQYRDEDPRFKYYHQQNHGASSARNHGLRKTTGDYITFIDSDDEIHPSMLHTLVVVLEKHRAQVASCQVAYITNDSAEYTMKDSDMQIVEGRAILTDFLKNKYGQSACARIYSKDIIRNTKFNTNFRINEDKLFIYNVFSNATKHIQLDRPMYHYHQIASSSSHSEFSKKFFDIELVADKILSDVCKRFPEEIAYARVQNSRSLLELYTNMTLSRIARKEYSEEYGRIRKKIACNRLKTLDSFISTLRLYIICYVPALYRPASYAYDRILRRKNLIV